MGLKLRERCGGVDGHATLCGVSNHREGIRGESPKSEPWPLESSQSDVV